jgi:hypothetical protein
MVAITLNKLFIILLLPSVVVVGNKKGQGPGSTEMTCADAMALELLTKDPHDDIEDKGTSPNENGLPFGGFPCGKYPFDGTGIPLKCTYFPAFKNYECECTTANCNTVVPLVKDTFVGAEQPCTAKDYVLSGQVKNWWWQCVYVGP